LISQKLKEFDTAKAEELEKLKDESAKEKLKDPEATVLQDFDASKAAKEKQEDMKAKIEKLNTFKSLEKVPAFLVEKLKQTEKNEQAESISKHTSVEPPKFTTKEHNLIEELVQQLNQPKLKKAAKNEIREMIIKELCKKPILFENFSKLLNSSTPEDVNFFEAYANVISKLGLSNLTLHDISVVKILVVNENMIGMELKQILLEELTQTAYLFGWNPTELKGLISSLHLEQDKNVVQKCYESLRNKEEDEVKTYLPKLSGANPALGHDIVLKKIFLINHAAEFPALNVFDVMKEFLCLMDCLWINAWKDEVIALLKDKSLQKELKLACELLNEGDTVCDFSQGRINEIAPQSGLTNVDGKNACGSICAEAIFFLDLHKTKTLTEEEIYQIIEKGVADHKAKGYGSKAAVFNELVKKIEESTQPNHKILQAFAPNPAGNTESLNNFALERYEHPLFYPYQGEVKTGFADYIHLLNSLSKEIKQDLYGVITCGLETVLVYQNADASWSLFDSHGRTYNGVSKGASVQKFADVTKLDDHLRKMYEKSNYFSMLIVGISCHQEVKPE
jgi:hypothetical protein